MNKIKHMAIPIDSSIQGEVYLCNQASGITKDKTTHNWNKVTCKNCLKQKPENKKIDSE